MQYKSWPRRWDQKLNAIPDALAIREWNGKKIQAVRSVLQSKPWRTAQYVVHVKLSTTEKAMSQDTYQAFLSSWDRLTIGQLIEEHLSNYLSLIWNETFKMKQAYHDDDPLSVCRCH